MLLTIMAGNRGAAIAGRVPTEIAIRLGIIAIEKAAGKLRKRAAKNNRITSYNVCYTKLLRKVKILTGRGVNG